MSYKGEKIFNLNWLHRKHNASVVKNCVQSLRKFVDDPADSGPHK